MGRIGLAFPIETILLVVRVLEVISLVLGLTVAYFAYVAHKREKSNSLLLLSVGFMALAAASLAEGILFEVMHSAESIPGMLEGHAARAILTIVGFLLVLFSIKLLK